MLNALTFDIEDYFQINAFSRVIRIESWETFESRVERNTHRILDLLDSAGGAPIRATFFVLGWIAERYPNIVKEIHARGHETASHGYAHQLIYTQTRAEFKEDVHKSKAILEDLTGSEVIGYRAPTYSITPRTLWALEVLQELGFQYDSSIFPIAHDVYGFPGAPRFPFRIDLGASPAESAPIPSCPRRRASREFFRVQGAASTIHTARKPPSHGHTRAYEASERSLTELSSSSNAASHMTEFPITTCRLGSRNLPISGGGYFRLLPYTVTRMCLNRINASERKPFVFYLHPWELDPDIPRINAGPRSTFRTYINLTKTESRLKRLLSDFHFAPLSDLILQMEPIDSRPHPDHSEVNVGPVLRTGLSSDIQTPLFQLATQQ